MTFSRLLPAALAAVLLVLAQPAAAESAASPWAETEHTAVRLVSAAAATGDARTLTAALHFRMAPGWKIYWRSPGDAGYPPRIDWSGSENVAGADIAWPAPERFSVLGLETLGYAGEVALPIAVELARPGAPAKLRAFVDYLTCAEICVPYQADLALDVPRGPAEPSAFTHLVERFASRVPGDGRALGIEIVSAAQERAAGAPLRVEALSRRPFVAPDVLVEGPPELAFAAPVVTLDDGGRRAVFDVAVGGGEDGGGTLAGVPVTLTVIDGERAAERALVVAGAAPAASAGYGLAAILGLALLGGLILNLMPCVLPVISIKLIGVVGHGGGDRGAVRAGFVASAAGIVTAFVILAAALAGLRAGGAAVGWGLQFQQPWFLAAMTLVVVLFACNLWGAFEIRLPSAIADAGVAAGRVQGLGGHFLTGMLATLLATPCSAPFLGTAVGFALSGGTAAIFAVFVALGVGLALPYLAVAAAPGLVTALPRPGPWMATLKKVMAVALFGTGAWLVSVLAAGTGVATASAVAVFAAAMAGVLFVRHRLPPRIAGLGGALAGAMAIAALAVPLGIGPGTGGRAAEPPDGAWAPFDERAIPALVADGKTVLVNVTAEWCITCRVNEELALGDADVASRLAADDVVAMQGDWTRPDETIARYLARFGRYGIPFDAVYGPGAPEGEVLPELLTPDIVLAALDRAGGGD